MEDEVANREDYFSYEHSLEILGMKAEDTFSSIYNQFMLCSNNLHAVLVHEAFEDIDNLPTKKLLYIHKKAFEAIQAYRLTNGPPME